jgi:hypothetical protein
MTIVNGHIVSMSGVLQTLDTTSIALKAHSIAEKLVKKATP